MKKIVILLSIIIVLYAAWTLFLNRSLVGSFIDGFIVSWSDAGWKVEPKTAAEYIDRGVQYVKNDKYTRAAECYQKAIELDPYGEMGTLAYSNLENLSNNLKTSVESQPNNWSQELFNSGVEHFDKAVELYNAHNYTEAKRYLELAMQIFGCSRTVDPNNRHAHGFIYISKGFFYHICGRENIGLIKPSDSNYAVMVYLRRACYPLTYADAYYKLAREYLKKSDYEDLLEGYRDLNDDYYKNKIEKYLPQTDYWAKPFMENIKKDVECAVTIDKINGMIVSGEYEEAIEVMTKFEKKLEKMDNQTGNRNGFIFLNLSYARLATIVPYFSQGREWTDEQRSHLIEFLRLCSADLKRARLEFGTAAYTNLCDNLMNYLQQMEDRL